GTLRPPDGPGGADRRAPHAGPAGQDVPPARGTAAPDRRWHRRAGRRRRAAPRRPRPAAARAENQRGRQGRAATGQPHHAGRAGGRRARPQWGALPSGPDRSAVARPAGGHRRAPRASVGTAPRVTAGGRRGPGAGRRGGGGGGGARALLAGETAAAPLRIAVERVALAKARFAFRDEAVSPVTTLTATDIGATATKLAWHESTAR